MIQPRVRREIVEERHRVGRRLIKQIVLRNHVHALRIRRVDRDAEIAVAAEHVEAFLIHEADHRMNRVFGPLLGPLGKRRRPPAAHAVVETALFRHAERRTRLQIKLPAEAIRAFVRRLAGDDFDLFIHRARERMQRGRTAIAAHARGRHAVDVQPGEIAGLPADAHVVDDAVLVRGPGDPRQPHGQFRHAEQFSNAADPSHATSGRRVATLWRRAPACGFEPAIRASSLAGARSHGATWHGRPAHVTSFRYHSSGRPARITHGCRDFTGGTPVPLPIHSLALLATTTRLQSEPRYGSTNTGVPTRTTSSSVSASQFASRKQPCDSVRPTFSGSGVP